MSNHGIVCVLQIEASVGACQWLALGLFWLAYINSSEMLATHLQEPQPILDTRSRDPMPADTSYSQKKHQNLRIDTN